MRTVPDCNGVDRGETLEKAVRPRPDVPDRVARSDASAGRRGLRPWKRTFTETSSPNLMMRPRGIRLADFGIAKLLDDPATITSPGDMVGTISYVAPEIIGGQQASASSDIYSLAAVAYEMLTGEKPYSADTTAGLLEMIRQSDGPNLAGKVPAEVVAAFARAMAKDPAMRHASARAFASALGQPSTLVLPVAFPTRAPLMFLRSSTVHRYGNVPDSRRHEAPTGAACRAKPEKPRKARTPRRKRAPSADKDEWAFCCSSFSSPPSCLRPRTPDGR